MEDALMLSLKRRLEKLANAKKEQDKQSQSQKSTSSQDDLIKSFNNPFLIDSIKTLLKKNATLSSHEIWETLVLSSPVELPEMVVEACMMANFDYPESATLRIKSVKADKAAMGNCRCARPSRLVTERDIAYYLDYPKDVSPKESISVSLLQVMLDTPSSILSFLPRDTPIDLAEIPVSSMSPAQRVYRLFYVEWDAWMGPPHGQVHPKNEYVDGLEAGRFQTHLHCGHNMTFWSPSMDYKFEEHVRRALKSPCSNWRCNFEWLTFALSQTTDLNTIMMVNSILVGKFGLKCRSLSNGFIEWQRWQSKWFYQCRVQDGRVAFVTPNEGDAEVKWAQKVTGKDHNCLYFYAPPTNNEEVLSPSHKLMAETKTEPGK